MPIVQDSGSSGGGSTTSICTPNPSDNLAILNNLLSRISDIERFLSLLVGADVYANNLSELATNLGNVANGTITLPQTGYISGGSIPVPSDFTGTFVSGNVTTIWENGTVRYEVTPSGGIVIGGGVESWLVLEPASATIASNVIDLSTILWQGGSAFDTTFLSIGRIDIEEAGYYRFSVNLGCQVRNDAGSSSLRATLKDSSLSTIKVFENLYGQHATPNNQNQTLVINGTFEATVGDVLVISGVTSTLVSLQNITSHAVSIEKLASV